MDSLQPAKILEAQGLKLIGIRDWGIDNAAYNVKLLDTVQYCISRETQRDDGLGS